MWKLIDLNVRCYSPSNRMDLPRCHNILQMLIRPHGSLVALRTCSPVIQLVHQVLWGNRRPSWPTRVTALSARQPAKPMCGVLLVWRVYIERRKPLWQFRRKAVSSRCCACVDRTMPRRTIGLTNFTNEILAAMLIQRSLLDAIT